MWAKQGLKIKFVSLIYTNKALFILHIEVGPNSTILVLVSNRNISRGRSNLPGINPETSKGGRIQICFEYTYIYIYLCIYIYKYIYLCIYINICIYIYIYESWLFSFNTPSYSQRLLLAFKWQLDSVANPGCPSKDLYSLEVQCYMGARF